MRLSADVERSVYSRRKEKEGEEEEESSVLCVFWCFGANRHRPHRAAIPSNDNNNEREEC